MLVASTNKSGRPCNPDRPGQPDRSGQPDRPGQPDRLGQADRPCQADGPGQADRLGQNMCPLLTDNIFVAATNRTNIDKKTGIMHHLMRCL